MTNPPQPNKCEMVVGTVSIIALAFIYVNVLAAMYVALSGGTGLPGWYVQWVK